MVCVWAWSRGGSRKLTDPMDRVSEVAFTPQRAALERLNSSERFLTLSFFSLCLGEIPCFLPLGKIVRFFVRFSLFQGLYCGRFLAERIFRGSLFLGRRIFPRIFSPDFFSSFLWEKCPEKFTRKIPRKILQNLYNKNPPKHVCRLPRANYRGSVGTKNPCSFGGFFSPNFRKIRAPIKIKSALPPQTPPLKRRNFTDMVFPAERTHFSRCP